MSNEKRNPLEILNGWLSALVVWFFGIFGMDKENKYVVWVIQFVKFNLVGLLNFVITTVIYSVLALTPVKPVAYAIGYGAGIVNSYICNKLWTFESAKSRVGKESVLFIVVCLAAYAVSQGLLLLLEAPLGNLAAYLVSTVVALAINYFGSKFVVFKR